MNDENQIPELPKVNEENQNIEVVETKEEVVEVPISEVKEENKVVEEIKNTAKKEIEISGKFFKDVKSYLTTKDSSELFSLLWRLLIIVGFIIILYFPVQMIMDLGANILRLAGIEYTTRVGTIWECTCNIIYSIVALLLFYFLCKSRFYKIVKQNNEK